MTAEHDCRRCAQEANAVDLVLDGRGLRFADRMIVCPACGNKRCPKATDHDLPCSSSNEPGQPGSVYE